MHNRFALVIVLAACLGLPSQATAGWACSIDYAYPEVSELRVENGKLVVVLGTYFATRIEKGAALHPHLELEGVDRWARVSETAPPKYGYLEAAECMDVPDDTIGAWNALNTQSAATDPPPDTDYSWFNQNINSCATDGEVIWGGISFYGAEGGWGAGGIVRKDVQTDEVVFLRPYELLHLSVEPLHYYAGELWFGANSSGECGGPSSGVGLRRLGEKYGGPFAYQIPEVCGFAIRDFQEFEGSLWVATELGLSKLTNDDGLKWKNYVPDLEHPDLMREVTCDTLYGELLRSDHLAKSASLDIGNGFDVFWERLTVFRPEFVRRYLREIHGHSGDNYRTE